MEIKIHPEFCYNAKYRQTLHPNLIKCPNPAKDIQYNLALHITLFACQMSNSKVTKFLQMF